MTLLILNVLAFFLGATQRGLWASRGTEKGGGVSAEAI